MSAPKAARTPTRRMLPYGAILAAGLLILALPEIVMRLRYSRPSVLDGVALEHVTPLYSLVVIRKRESVEAPPPGSRPDHRPSRVALYRKSGEAWHQSNDPLPIRSESTTLFPPGPADVHDVLSFLTSDKYYVYGNQSVPTGIYWCTWRTDPEARHPYALAISDFGSLDNTISLRRDEVLCTFTDLATAPLTLSEVVPLDPIITKRDSKSACFIHGSINSDWMHRDSKGCMNLLRLTKAGQQESDWDAFQGWFSDYRLESDGPIVLIVLRDERSPFGDLLPGQLTNSEMERLMSLAKADNAS